jgi:hypothetical protein
MYVVSGPSFGSSGQFWLQTPWFRVQFPALRDFQSSGGSGTAFTQPQEDNLKAI